MKTILHNWGGIIVEADIDTSNAIAIVKYSDHGDDLVRVKTFNGIFEYGWFMNRECYPEYRQIEENHDYYVGDDKSMFVAPKLFKGEDVKCEIKNYIFRETEDLVFENAFAYKTRIDSNAQWRFNNYLECMKNVYEGKERRLWGGFYEGSYHYDGTYDVKRYLEKNDIFTEENQKKLEELKKYWRIGEIDGTAGIVKSWNVIVGDRIEWVWYRGKRVKIKSVKKKRIYEHIDALGDFKQFKMSLDQFK